MNWVLAHLVGDFILQNDWMSRNKKTNNIACTVHVITYLLPFLFTSISAWKLVLIGIEHFIQDRTTIVEKFLLAVGKKDFTVPPLAPWSMIVVDTIFHILFISILL